VRQTLGALLAAAAAAWAPAACGPSSIIFGTSQDIDLSVQREMTVTGNWEYTPDEDGLGGVYKITGGEVAVSGTTTSSRLVIAGSARVTLKDASIIVTDDFGLGWDTYGICPISLEEGVSLNLILSGRNVLKAGNLCAGLHVPAGSSLTITTVDGSGSLAADGGHEGAGIGGNYNDGCGAVTILSGNVTATGGWAYAAGIGGGHGGNLAGPVMIEGGIVTATGWGGAGIGGGGYNFAMPGEIIITGGYVEATGWNNGAGIGGGSMAPGGTVKINFPTGDSHGRAMAKITTGDHPYGGDFMWGFAVGPGATDGRDLSGGTFNGTLDGFPMGEEYIW
jgi:hypothetical protein